MTTRVEFKGAWADFQTESGEVVVKPGCTRKIRASNNMELVISCGSGDEGGTIGIQNLNSLFYPDTRELCRVILGTRRSKGLFTTGLADLMIGEAQIGIARGCFANLELGGNRVATVMHVPDRRK